MPLIQYSASRLKDLLRLRKRPIAVRVTEKSKKAPESEPDPRREERPIPVNVQQPSRSSTIFSFLQPSPDNSPLESLSEFLAWSAEQSAPSTPASTPPPITTPLSLPPTRPSRPRPRPRPQSAPVPPAAARRDTGRRSAAPPFVAKGPETAERAVSAGTEMELERWWGGLHAQEKVAVREVWDGVMGLVGRMWLMCNLKGETGGGFGGDDDSDRRLSRPGEMGAGQDGVI